MQSITIICLGKLKEDYLRAAVDEYKKRLSAFAKLQIIELSPEKLSDNPSEAQIKAALKTESKIILSKIPSNSYVFSMCIEGKQRSSEKLAREIEEIGVKGFSNIVFIIGSSFGLADEVKDFSNAKLSMSEMTFPHQLARVMLLEQIYRCFQILNGGKYHK